MENRKIFLKIIYKKNRNVNFRVFVCLYRKIVCETSFFYIMLCLGIKICFFSLQDQLVVVFLMKTLDETWDVNIYMYKCFQKFHTFQGTLMNLPSQFDVIYKPLHITWMAKYSQLCIPSFMSRGEHRSRIGGSTSKKIAPGSMRPSIILAYIKRATRRIHVQHHNS